VRRVQQQFVGYRTQQQALNAVKTRRAHPTHMMRSEPDGEQPDDQQLRPGPVADAGGGDHQRHLPGVRKRSLLLTFAS